MNENPACSELTSMQARFSSDTKAWQNLDANLSAGDWNADQKGIVDAVIPVMTQFSDDFEKAARSSSNATLEDFAVLSSQYRRAYVGALPTYGPSDSYLIQASGRLTSAILLACKTVGA
jgi:hypothetical protein